MNEPYWTFHRPEDVTQFAGDQDDIGQLDSSIVMDLFNTSDCEYGTAYSTEDQPLVDFYDALMEAWQRA